MGVRLHRVACSPGWIAGCDRRPACDASEADASVDVLRRAGVAQPMECAVDSGKAPGPPTGQRTIVTNIRLLDGVHDRVPVSPEPFVCRVWLCKVRPCSPWG